MKASSPTRPSFNQALRYWFKLGCISFGGPAGQIALMHQELVERKRWISEERFTHALRFCMALPGPEAQQLATYIGWSLHGIRGGIAAGSLFILPSFFILLGISWIYAAFGNSPWLSQTFYGIKPAVLALVFMATWRMGRRTLKNPFHISMAVISFLAVTVWHVAFPWVLIFAAVAGWAWMRFHPSTTASESDSSTSSTASSKAPKAAGENLTATNQKPNGRHTLHIWLHGAWMWGLPFTLLLLFCGWQHMYTQMGWFFTKAAWLTFGGAYAVLPYVFQAAVQQYHWITTTQMVDGLALGESTPGPLIMVVTFVAFLGGYQQPQVIGNLGDTYPFWAGALAMVIATWFTFLPSFLFILSGAPWIDSLKDAKRWQAPMAAMTAAIVGVMAQLGFQLAWLILWPKTGHSTLPTWENFTWHSLDWMSAGLMALTLLVLFRSRIPIVAVLALSAGLGVLGQMLK
jgi:chromate transporter